jgi:hypothetical protein
MNKEIRSIYHRITENQLFAPERLQTKTAVETVLAKIGDSLDKTDLNLLETLEICAPAGQPLFLTIPRGEHPVVLLSSEIENVEGPEAEHCTARAFAEGIATAKNVGKSKIPGEVDRMLRAWNYPVATKGEAAVGA